MQVQPTSRALLAMHPLILGLLRLLEIIIVVIIIIIVIYVRGENASVDDAKRLATRTAKTERHFIVMVISCVSQAEEFKDR
jgi:hypothetical protein